MAGPRKLMTIAAFVVLVSCGGASRGENYPPEIADPFLNSCTAGGASREICQCALDKLEEKYSVDEFAEESVKFNQGTASQEFQEDITSFSLACAEEAQ